MCGVRHEEFDLGSKLERLLFEALEELWGWWAQQGVFAQRYVVWGCNV
jgi:hypothetical protein